VTGGHGRLEQLQDGGGVGFQCRVAEIRATSGSVSGTAAVTVKVVENGSQVASLSICPAEVDVEALKESPIDCRGQRPFPEPHARPYFGRHY
jgi:hypothetical protein